MKKSTKELNRIDESVIWNDDLNFEEIKEKAENGDINSKLQLAYIYFYDMFEEVKALNIVINEELKDSLYANILIIDYYIEFKENILEEISEDEFDLLKEKFDWFSKFKAKNESELNQVDLIISLMFYYGMGVEIDVNKYIQINIKLAEKGENSAKYNLAYVLENGKGVDVDIKKAYDLYLTSAEDGYSRSQTAIALAFEYGNLGLKEDNNEAYKWFLKAAIQEERFAQYSLGFEYYYGNDILNIEKNIEESKKWLLKSAKNRCNAAMLLLGDVMNEEDSLEGKKDAYNWYLRAAKRSNEDAMLKVGMSLLTGIGVDKNEEEGFYWLLKLAKKGNNKTLWTVEELFLDNEIHNFKEQNYYNIFLSLSEHGNMDANRLMIEMLFNRKSKLYDNDKAFDLLKKLEIKNQNTFISRLIRYKMQNNDENKVKLISMAVEKEFEDKKYYIEKMAEIYLSGIEIGMSVEKLISLFVENECNDIDILTRLFIKSGGIEEVIKNEELIKKVANITYSDLDFAKMYVSGIDIPISIDELISRFTDDNNNIDYYSNNNLIGRMFLKRGNFGDKEKAEYYFNKEVEIKKIDSFFI